MKDKKGFTLVELLAVIAILAVLVIIALPNVLKLFRNAKENTFANEVQNLVRSAEDKYLTSSLLSGKNTCFDSKTNPLDMSGRENINYLIKLTNKGKVIEVKVMDDSYQLLIDNENGINKADIGNKYKIEARNKTTDILDCNNSFLVQGEEGTGEANAPYKIQYIEDLVELSENVESGQTYAGKTIVLSRNLDFKNKDSYRDKNNSELYTQLTTGTGFPPIKTFSGTFDGKNHRIDNLYINITDENWGNIAFISNLVSGNVKNLTVQGKVETTAQKNSISGIVGKIENSTIDNCINEVVVTSTGNYGVGGLVSYSNGNSTIKNSINKANVIGVSATGGIIGTNQGGTLTIENCKNYGTITNELGSVVAGIYGSDTTNSTKTIIKNSTNYGEIVGKTTNGTILYLGGLVGTISKKAEINNSNNEGKIIINSNSGFSAGGLIGNVTGTANISNSHNKNTITSNKTDNVGGRDIGGLVGNLASTQTSIIINSSNEKTGVISGGDRTGGLIGRCESGLIMNNSYNLASISSTSASPAAINLGGLFGLATGWNIKHEDIIILNSYNKGNLETININNYNSAIGGLIGAHTASNPANAIDTSTNIKIINSYNQGNITINGTTTGLLTATGIMNIGLKSVTLNNVYNIGTLNSIKTNNVITNNNSNVTTNYKNVYYLNSLSGTKPDDTTNVLSKSESEMKNQSFVTLLNSNKSSIDLSSIDSRLSGYTLCNWKLGASHYPELDCK